MKILNLLKITVKRKIKAMKNKTILPVQSNKINIHVWEKRHISCMFTSLLRVVMKKKKNILLEGFKYSNISYFMIQMIMTFRELYKKSG